MPTLLQDTVPPRRHELYFFALFRTLEAGILGLIAFSPLGQTAAQVREPVLIKAAAAVYLVVSAILLATSRNADFRVRRQTAIGMAFDLMALGAALLALNGAESGIAMFMIFNIGAGALILTPAASFGFAFAAAATLLTEYFFNRLTAQGIPRTAAEATMFSVTYFGAAVLCQQLRKQMSASEALAEKRGEELANLAELNELVIRRMRTGILVVDGGHSIRLANEAAWALLGNPSPTSRELTEVAPLLEQSLWQWRQGRNAAPPVVTFVEGGVEVLPRFVALSLTDKLFLIFLENNRIYSGRAEELTLAALGRLSASIAHEIRNPLAAISYAAQLLDESSVVPDTDRRLLEIIRAQCQRMNGIVQNILGLARQERSQAESLELMRFAREFVQEYRASHPLETDELRAATDLEQPLPAIVDPQHLHQVLTILVHNALTYGRTPGSPAHVTVTVRSDGPRGAPLIEVTDCGPGIPAPIAEQIFEPFYTTSDYGTGLGLYIAKQLCEANQCLLSYLPAEGGGSCFRITLPSTRYRLPQE
jgi:two-component system sensor histidine kinase PilS (NtrC family)